MTIKNIIKLTAILLGRENVVDYLQTGDGDTQTLYQVDVMTRCANVVLNELACTYAPMVICEIVNTKNGRIYYSEFKEVLRKIRRVTGLNGKDASFEKHTEYLSVKEPCVTVEYEYVPCNYGTDDIVGYSETSVPTRIIAYGTCAEYCLTERAFDDAVIFHKKYTDGIAEICSPKNIKIKERSFV